MAYAAVLSLMQILQQIRDPVRYVRHSKLQIQSLQEKVSSFHDFLETYYVYTDKVVKDLEIKIRGTAYKAEDIIESHVSTFFLYKRKYRNSRYRTFCKDLDRVIKEIHSIQQEMVKVKRILDIKYVQQRNHLPTNGSRLTFSDKIPPMVGLVEDTIKLKDWLTSSSSKREVISIIGMGGIGKTTFAKNLFDDSLIVCKFDVRAWVTVSQEYHMREILAGLLDSTSKLSSEMKKASCEDLAELLYKTLKGRTYLIVMDDIWDSKVWDEVNRFFPDDHNGSRIVSTTRLKNVGDHMASFDSLHNMSLLSSSESWNLFREKVFGGECCPPCLEGIGQEIIRNCRGLPLSILVIGGLLSMEKTVGYWETIATTPNSSILSTDGGQCSTIMSLSYNQLPARLKPCFLYFANFPEDYDIRRSELVRLWIAEGFIKSNDESKRLEDIAEEYLQDLSNRSLIMVLKLGHHGKVKTYRIHDLLREFCITEARKEKFLHVTNKYTLSHLEGMRSERRVSIQPVASQEFIEYIFNPNEQPLPTRSVLLYDHYVHIIISERGFGLLRVLDMRSGILLLKFPIEVVRLVHLRYLSVRCRRAIVPASISSIWGLQTLDINSWILSTHPCQLPLEVWTMPHLRHVHLRDCDCHLPDPPHSGVEGKNFVILANLQTLSTIKNLRFTDEIIKRIPKLKKLGLFYDVKSEDWSQFHLSNIVCLNELETLNIVSDSKIDLPPNLKLPAALKKLTLSGCEICWEDLTMVGSLPNLEVLKLHFNACASEVWEPNEGEFRELKFLDLYMLSLVEWRADDSHFPKLKCLKISGCSGLKDIIESYVSTSILSEFDGGNNIRGFQPFCRDMDTVIEETLSIQQEVTDIKRMLDLNYVQQRNTLPVDRSRLTFTDRKDPHMVGLVEDTIKLKDWLTSSSSKREVISIVGMGGIGKTTFAKNLFGDPLIVQHFHVRFWATVSQEYQMHEILEGLLDSTSKASSEDLAERLYKSLKGKTYLIVMDDIWDIKVWDEVKRIFPDDHNGSRIVLTTRLKIVGVHAACTGRLHDMNFLSSNESWNLFCEKVFRGECCPPCLEGIGQEIIRNCRGLPLSIVVIGGLLSMDKTVGCWETIATTLNSSILSTDGGQCSTILSLSYNHLPAHLKPCFVYFAIFPEDYKIRRSELIKLWIAEGFIKPNESKILEDIAEERLEDLLNRSLIMVLKLGHHGKVKTYRIHDLLRDFCITEAQKENFLRVINRYTTSHLEGIRSERRVSIQPFTPFKSRILNSNEAPLPTRSLLWYDNYNGKIISEQCRFRLLRVLDLGSRRGSFRFPIEVVRLVHLRYLALCCSVGSVPASISLLRDLQTLVIVTAWSDHNIHLPREVWTMLNLRHLQVQNLDLPDPRHSGVERTNFVVLANLQILSTTRNFRFTDEIIKRIPKLKKLGVCYDVESEDWSQFHLSNIVCLNELETLHITSYSQIDFPPNFKFPAALKKLTLFGCELRWEDFTIVGSLPNLEVLKLEDDACEGEVWEPNEGEFCQLKFLRLHHLDLVDWRVDDSHFPKLRRLKISGCYELKEIPIEIGNIPTLEMIELDDASTSTVASAELILDEQRSFGNDVLQVCIKK